MLRKACQDVLDIYQVDDLHASIDYHLKLAIVSECGKPFVTIQGVEFNRQIPTKLEIEYAAELLDNFLATHISDISAYRKRKAIFDKLPTTPEEGEFVLHGQSNGNHSADLSVSWESDTFSYIAYKSGKLTFNLKGSKVKDETITAVIARMKKLKHDPKQVTTAKAIIKKWKKYDEERLFLVNLKTKLSSCNI